MSPSFGAPASALTDPMGGYAPMNTGSRAAKCAAEVCLFVIVLYFYRFNYPFYICIRCIPSL